MKETKSAVALNYDEVNAPRVCAKGSNELAEEILSLAQEHGIPVREEPELVELLSQLELGEEIPEQLYVAVAEVLHFAYRIRDQLSDC